MESVKARKSKLLPVGICFSILGVLLPIVIGKLAWSLEFEGESTRAIFLLLAAALAILLPLGVIFIIVGIIKNRKAGS
jgi:hypothetical protein